MGDGAVGLSAVLASKRLGAERIIALSRNPARQQVAREFGATDILAERGDDAIAAVLELTSGIGVDAALECVGTGQSMATALAVARPGSTVGVVGAPHGVDVPFEANFWRAVGWQGGVAPARCVHPRTARRCPQRGDQPRPRLRLRDRPRRHRRRLRSDGRTAGDQVPRSGRVDLMATWTDEELDRIGGATELQLTSVRENGSLRSLRDDVGRSRG